MRNIRLTIEYDGTAFAGWQRQPGQRSVQGEVERALSALLKQPVAVSGASRTDAGVHAFGQQANFAGEYRIPTERLKKAVNGYLPDDVRIVDAVEVDKGFHCRFSAVGKTYVYKILNKPEPDVFCRNTKLFMPEMLDVEAMDKAARLFEGTHDFKAFSANNGEADIPTVRTIHRFRAAKMDQDTVLLKVTGNAFLYKMVRLMTGALIEIGLGKHRPEAVSQIVSGEQERIGKTARPHGLYLLKVYYDENEMLEELK